MSKFNPTLAEMLQPLVIHMLFKEPEGLDAYYIADNLRMNLADDSDSFFGIADKDEPLKGWIRLGGKVNFAWLENHGALEYLTMGQHSFDKLRIGDPILHTEMKVKRDKANKRWSNDWKQIQPRILASKSLANMKPSQGSLELTWRSMASSCERKLQQRNMQAEAIKIQELFINSLGA